MVCNNLQRELLIRFTFTLMAVRFTEPHTHVSLKITQY